jgi:hypothetical protein
MFYGDLAITLHKSLTEIMALPSWEISYWLARCRTKALPDSLWQTGLMCSTLVNVMTGAKAEPEDFVPKPPKTHEQLAREASLRKLEAKIDAEMGRKSPANNMRIL